jgi:hypothetical protein
MSMNVKKWFGYVLVVACGIVAWSGAAARNEEKAEGGQGSAFKSKTYQIDENSEVSVVLSFEAGKEVTATTKGEKETDVHLFVKGKYFEAKDTSPGPESLVKFTPVKGDDKFTLTVKNKGPGANKVTLEVKVAE